MDHQIYMKSITLWKLILSVFSLLIELSAVHIYTARTWLGIVQSKVLQQTISALARGARHYQAKASPLAGQQ